MFVASNAARAESLHGKFPNGQAYSGEYSIAESSNADGMRVNPVTVKLKVDGEKDILLHTYVADDLPSVKASDMGFLSIVVNSGGMEGSVTYNYVILNQGALVSIGIVQTTLHLGKIESIDVQRDKNLTKDEINEFVKQIVRFNPPALSEPLNAYPAATLLLLGQGRFLTPEDDFRLSALYGNNEISADPVLLRAIKSAIIPIQSKDDALSIDPAGEIRICNTKSSCKNIIPDGDLKKAIDEGYEHLSIVDIYKNGDHEVAATSAGGCSRFFLFNRAAQTFSALTFSENDGDACNYKIAGNHLISSYKLDSKQYEDIYEIKNGVYQLVLSDGCVGCDQVTRSVYQDGRLSGKLLVTNQRSYIERRPVTSSVTAGKAWLYSEPTSVSITKMYLVKGDKVQLLEFDDSDGLWYFVKCITKENKTILKWAKCKDLAICN
jgi:hypothetical protein